MKYYIPVVKDPDMTEKIEQYKKESEIYEISLTDLLLIKLIEEVKDTGSGIYENLK